MATTRKLLSILIIFIVIVFSNDCLACSMIKVTKNGKTIVGNNEDSSNPNTRIWFESGKDGHYGVVYVGFDNLYPQGGMNEAGLVFDGFTQSKREVKDTVGKNHISALDLEKKLMQECSTVEEVKTLIGKYNISFWTSAVLRFIDKTGKYLYVDGDSLIIGQQDYFIQTNIRPYEKKKCWRFEKATRLLENHYDSSIEYCKSVMDSIHQETNWGGTLYTTMYDLENATVYLYYFYDFKNAVSFNLKEELKKGDKILNITELFPNNNTGKVYYRDYNNILSLLKQLSTPSLANETESIRTIKDSIYNSSILKYIWVSKISNFGDLYLDKKEYQIAIRYFTLNVELFPDLWYVFDNLGSAYMKNKQYKLALDNYFHSIDLNSDNPSSKKQVEELKRMIEK